jgi:desulfoferrodoxin (superoxide reductase-like protein)
MIKNHAGGIYMTLKEKIHGWMESREEEFVSALEYCNLHGLWEGK